MRKTSKDDALRVAGNLFEALAPRLIEHGVTSSEVEALLRAVVVLEAARMSKQYGRRPNVSQVSIKTGVDRHAVSGLLRAPLIFDSAAISRRDATSRVLTGWTSDPNYSKNLRPLIIPIGDPKAKGRTAWRLAQRYAPGVWPRLVIDELIRLNYVTVLPEGRLRLRTKTVHKSVPRLTGRLATSKLLNDAGVSIMECLVHRRRRTWRTVQSVQIGRSKMPLIRKMIQERLDSTFAGLAEELGSTRWKSRNGEVGQETIIGVSAFTYERKMQTSND